jgi:MarR family transcriptional regulator, organic hydroperoxide resistance regulator
MDSPGFAKARRCACGNVRRTNRALTQFYDQHLKPSGLRATQFSLLLNISLHHGIMAGELGEILIMDQTTVTRNLEALRKLGYIDMARETSDARKKHITVTSKGAAVMNGAMPLWEGAQAVIEAGLGNDRFREFLKTLAQISELSK